MEFIVCKACAVPLAIEVSQEDPDASMEDALDHVRTRHPGATPEVWLELEARA